MPQINNPETSFYNFTYLCHEVKEKLIESYITYGKKTK